MKGARQLIIALTFVLITITAIMEYHIYEAQKIEIKAVLDRFEGDYAVLLLEHWNEEVLILKEDLPEGSKENMWFQLAKKNNNYKVTGIDKETSKRKRELARRLNSQLKDQSK